MQPIGRDRFSEPRSKPRDKRTPLWTRRPREGERARERESGLEGERDIAQSKLETRHRFSGRRSRVWKSVGLDRIEGGVLSVRSRIGGFLRARA